MIQTLELLCELFCSKWKINALIADEHNNVIVDLTGLSPASKRTYDQLRDRLQNIDTRHFIAQFQHLTEPLIISSFVTLRPSILLCPIFFGQRKLYGFFGYFVDESSLEYIGTISQKDRRLWVDAMEELPSYTERERKAMMQQLSAVTNILESLSSAESSDYGNPETTGSLAALDPLTSREREVYSYLIKGLSNKGIATQLFISENTVKTHISHIMQKLNVCSRNDIGTTSRR